MNLMTHQNSYPEIFNQTQNEEPHQHSLEDKEFEDYHYLNDHNDGC